MQWDASPGAGFTTGEPWLPLGDFAAANVEGQREDPASLLSLHRRLIALRRAEPALSLGGWTPVDAEGDVLAYIRSQDGARFLVALNLGPSPARLAGDWAGEIAVSTHPDADGRAVSGAVELRGDEGLAVRLRA